MPNPYSVLRSLPPLPYNPQLSKDGTQAPASDPETFHVFPLSHSLPDKFHVHDPSSIQHARRALLVPFHLQAKTAKEQSDAQTTDYRQDRLGASSTRLSPEPTGLSRFFELSVPSQLNSVLHVVVLTVSVSHPIPPPPSLTSVAVSGQKH